jgi:hypothetical protein
MRSNWSWFDRRCELRRDTGSVLCWHNCSDLLDCMFNSHSLHSRLYSRVRKMNKLRIILALLFVTYSAAASAQGVYGGAATIFGSVTAQYFVTSANGTYTPNANLLYAIVECVGQGGGGGGAAASASGVSSGGGGGAGGYSRVRLTAAQIGASQAVTNTAAANGGTTGNNAGTGGNDTSLGSLCVGKGGGGGGGAATTADGVSGAGGVAGTGDLTIVGNAGGRGEGATITTAPAGAGQGAHGPWGGAPAVVQGSSSAVGGNAGTACGAGGGGGSVVGSASTAAGGQGGNGCVIVTEYNSR